MLRAPLALSVQLRRSRRWFWLSKLAWASTRSSPLKTMSLLTTVTLPWRVPTSGLLG